MTREVLLVLAEYGREHEGAALAILTAAAARLFPAASVRTVVVDNASTGGDNRVHEFSAWDQALRQDGARGFSRADADTIVILANDTVGRADKRARIEAIPPQRAEAAACGALVGVVDEYPRRVEAFGYAFRQFVDTSFFMTTARTLTVLGPLAQPPADADVFDDDWRRFFREPSPLGARYRAYLRAYLFGEPIHEDFPHRWHGCAPVDASNAEAFRARIRCVFCEHLLSARATARGIPLVDIRSSPVRIERPRVSVVVPCYNLGEYVEEAVDSVLAQSFTDFEIVVVDDGSTDERTIEVLDSLRRPKTRTVRAPHGGLAAARNLGIARTSGDYVCALDADD